VVISLPKTCLNEFLRPIATPLYRPSTRRSRRDLDILKLTFASRTALLLLRGSGWSTESAAAHCSCRDEQYPRHTSFAGRTYVDNLLNGLFAGDFGTSLHQLLATPRVRSPCRYRCAFGEIRPRPIPPIQSPIPEPPVGSHLPDTDEMGAFYSPICGQQLSGPRFDRRALDVSILADARLGRWCTTATPIKLMTLKSQNGGNGMSTWAWPSAQLRDEFLMTCCAHSTRANTRLAHAYPCVLPSGGSSPLVRGALFPCRPPFASSPIQKRLTLSLRSAMAASMMIRHRAWPPPRIVWGRPSCCSS